MITIGLRRTAAQQLQNLADQIRTAARQRTPRRSREWRITPNNLDLDKIQADIERMYGTTEIGRNRR